MIVSIIQIGNSKGIRLGKTLLEKYHITDKVDIVLEADHIVLKPVVVPRKSWEVAFAEMHNSGDDKLLMDSVFPDENFEDI
jgi:antitoxin MazE